MRESAEQFKNHTLEEIALNKDILHDRLTRFLRLLSEKLENSNEGTRDLPGLFNVARELAIQVYELDTQGISVINELKKLANSGDAEARRLLNISGDDNTK
jgi:hypothetical protein